MGRNGGGGGSEEFPGGLRSTIQKEFLIEHATIVTHTIYKHGHVWNVKIKDKKNAQSGLNPVLFYGGRKASCNKFSHLVISHRKGYYENTDP